MKITQISKNIWSLHTWIIIPFHVWLVAEEDGLTLIDAGLPFMYKSIMKRAASLQVGPIKRIALTHAHPDHVGALPRVAALSDAAVYAHRLELPYIDGEKTYQSRKKPAPLLPQDRKALALPEDADGKLQQFGSLTPYWTPGHSPGHTVFYHQEDDVLIAGDLFWSRRGRLIKPRFTEDMAQAIRSSAIVAELNPGRLEVCHGYAVHKAAGQIESYAQQTIAQ